MPCEKENVAMLIDLVYGSNRGSYVYLTFHPLSDPVLASQSVSADFRADRSLRWARHPSYRVLSPCTWSPHWQIHNRQVWSCAWLLSLPLRILFYSVCLVVFLAQSLLFSQRTARIPGGSRSPSQYSIHFMNFIAIHWDGSCYAIPFLTV